MSCAAWRGAVGRFLQWSSSTFRPKVATPALPMATVGSASGWLTFSLPFEPRRRPRETARRARYAWRGLLALHLPGGNGLHRARIPGGDPAGPRAPRSDRLRRAPRAQGAVPFVGGLLGVWCVVLQPRAAQAPLQG